MGLLIPADYSIYDNCELGVGEKIIHCCRVKRPGVASVRDSRQMGCLEAQGNRLRVWMKDGKR